VIDELRSREGSDGFVRLELPRRRRYGPGAKVRVRKGVLVGLTGAIAAFVGQDKLKMLVDMLGRPTLVTLSETEITAA
jgi:transcription antitermination factor NusG